MTAHTPPAGSGADAAWAKVRAMGDIQYTPLTPLPDPPRQDPPWMRALGQWLAKWIGPIGQWLDRNWHWVEIGALVIAVLGVAWVIWAAWQSRSRIKRRAQVAADDAADWRPDRAIASALLADADQLAAAGRFDAAVHLLLRRSFDDIAQTRPDWLTPASTAREIARLAALPGAARAAFAVITREVERSRYALHPLGHPDWTRARSAYAAFAVPERPGGQSPPDQTAPALQSQPNQSAPA